MSRQLSLRAVLFGWDPNLVTLTPGAISATVVCRVVSIALACQTFS